MIFTLSTASHWRRCSVGTVIIGGVKLPSWQGSPRRLSRSGGHSESCRSGEGNKSLMTTTEEDATGGDKGGWTSEERKSMGIVADADFSASANCWLTQEGSSKGAKKTGTKGTEDGTRGTALEGRQEECSGRTWIRSRTDRTCRDMGWERTEQTVGIMTAAHGSELAKSSRSDDWSEKTKRGCEEMSKTDEAERRAEDAARDSEHWKEKICRGARWEAMKQRV